MRQGLYATHQSSEAVQRRRRRRGVRPGVRPHKPRRVLELQVVGGAQNRRMAALLRQLQAQCVAKPTALPIAGPSNSMCRKCRVKNIKYYGNVNNTLIDYLETSN